MKKQNVRSEKTTSKQESTNDINGNTKQSGTTLMYHLHEPQKWRVREIDIKCKSLLEHIKKYSISEQLKEITKLYNAEKKSIKAEFFDIIDLCGINYIIDGTGWALGETAEFPNFAELIQMKSELRLVEECLKNGSITEKCNKKRDEIVALFRLLKDTGFIRDKLTNTELSVYLSGLTGYTAEQIRQRLSNVQIAKPLEEQLKAILDNLNIETLESRPPKKH